jgi:hypothetical protein
MAVDTVTESDPNFKHSSKVERCVYGKISSYNGGVFLVPSLRKLPLRVRKTIGLYPQLDEFSSRPFYFSMIHFNTVPSTSRNS